MAQNNTFAIELFRLVSDAEDKSLVISPLSLSCSLAMAMLGAKNETAKQIQACISKGSINFQEIHENFSNILSSIKMNEEVRIANKTFLSNTVAIFTSYKSEMNKFYDGQFQCVDFENNKEEEAAKEMNSYVSDATNQKIQKMVKPEMFNAQTAFVIINAIYFDKKWLLPFTLMSSQINQIKFYSKPDVIHEIPFLAVSNEFRYVKTEEYQIVELPYQGEEFSMIIILPCQNHQLDFLLRNFDFSRTMNLLMTANKIKGTVIIPKFKTESCFNQLTETFKRMGIVDAFEATKADFSNTSHESLYISSIIHKTFIEVDESGTKAAAATALKVRYIAAYGQESFNFLADHPFLYLIVDQAKNIYFIGTFYN